MDRKLVEARLARLAKEAKGVLTPDAVVQDAARKDSPLHDCFEWDDTKAGAAYRLEQARRLIRSVKIEITTTERILTTVRYVKDPDSDGQGYVNVAKLQGDSERALDALKYEVIRMNSIIERVAGLIEVLGLHDEFRMLETGFVALREKLDKAA